MMLRMALFGVFVCSIIALQLVFAFEWKNISRNIVACEHDDAQLRWEYVLLPGEYVKAKTWFTGENKTAKRIAYWKDTDGIKIETAFLDRVTVTGDGSDSLILRRVTTSDEGIYTLIPFFPLSSNPDPRLALNLRIYVPPLQEKGCCKPDINATNDELHAFLYSEQGCGKPLPTLNWNISKNKMVMNDTLILGDNDRVGTYKVCLIGPAVARCFKGNEENLCESHTEQIEKPQTDEEKASNLTGVLIGIILPITFVVVVAFLVICFFKKREIKARRNAEEKEGLLRDLKYVGHLTEKLVHMYRQQPQFGKAATQINLQTEIIEGSSRPEPDIDINKYRNIFDRNGKPLTRILIQGAVGCGKTTWCNTLTQEWSEAHTNPNNQQSNDNITFLKQYKLLFYIPLANVHKCENFQELLHSLNYSMFELLNIDIYDYIQKYEAIIIIQGFEEFTADRSMVLNILSDKGLEKAVFIITSTPWIWSKCSKETSVDRIISIKGLEKDDMMERAKQMLNEDCFPQEIIDEFRKSISSKELEEFTTEPVFFPFLLEIWKVNCSMPNNRAEILLAVLDKQIKERVLSLNGSGGDYKFSFEYSLVLKNKQFIIHCGKIVKFLGEIAVKILIVNKNETTIGKQEFDGIVQKQNLTAQNSYQYIIDFCDSTKLVSITLTDEGVIHTISFRHQLMQLFLAAIYISTLKEDEKQSYICLIQSSNELREFLTFLLNDSNE